MTDEEELVFARQWARKLADKIEVEEFKGVPFSVILCALGMLTTRYAEAEVKFSGLDDGTGARGTVQ